MSITRLMGKEDVLSLSLFILYIFYSLYIFYYPVIKMNEKFPFAICMDLEGIMLSEVS